MRDGGDRSAAPIPIICVPFKDPEWSAISDIHDISPSYRDEIEHFFSHYGALEGKTVETEGFGNRSEAERFIVEARERFAREGGETV